MICGKIIRECDENPVRFESLWSEDYRYLDIFHNEQICGQLAFMITGDKCIFHLEVDSWTPGIAKTMIKAFNREFLPGLKEIGVAKIITMKPGIEDIKWFKFLKVFGFKQPINYMYTERMI
jgi:hypothetical protein